MDDNDRLRAGELPDDPLAGTEPVPVPGAPATPGPVPPERLGEILAPEIARLDARRSGDENPLATPWPSLNDAIGGGLWPGMVTLTADSAVGKTQAALQLLYHAARARIPSLYVGLEMDRLGIVARLLCIAYNYAHNTAMKWGELYQGKRTFTGNAAVLPKPEELVVAARPLLEGLPLYLRFGGPKGWNMGELQAHLVAMKPQAPGKYDLMLAVVDFLQLVAPEPEAHGELRETIRTAAYTARALAREQNACIMLVSSTARDNYPVLAGDRRPWEKGGKPTKSVTFNDEPAKAYLGTGKESGEIEYAADLALVLCRQRWKKGETPAPVWCAVAKQRAGETDWVELRFDGAMLTDPHAGGDHDKGW